MISEELVRQVEEHLGHAPTAEQHRAVQVFAEFMLDREPQTIMVLRGSAGTGKTTLAAAVVRTLLDMKQKLMLMAPTGRAAKVFSLYAGQPAYTIHRRIYRQKSAVGTMAFSLNDNLHTDTLFMVDEASMISGDGLLDDLVRYVYGGRNCRMILIGDTAQLPPVGEEVATALSTDVLRCYGLSVHETDLNEVLRQSRQSGILWNATRIREYGETADMLPRIKIKGFADISIVPGDELIESLASSYSRVGTDETMVVTRSNKRCNVYNQGIRNTVLDREEELSRGDRLMVVKNNYHWSTNTPLPFIANGDHCVVQRVRNIRELYGFRFADVTLQFPDYEDLDVTATVLLDTLTSEAPALTAEQQNLLYEKVMEDYVDIPLKADRMRKLKADPYFNALQVKYGYAVTCHKAQGGQWAHIYIDQGYMTDDMLTSDYFHWLYTALTRATERVFLVNWPKAQIEE